MLAWKLAILALFTATTTTTTTTTTNNNNNNNNNFRLIIVKTNRSTLHTVYNIQQSSTHGSNDTTHRLSRRKATTRFSSEGVGYQKQTAPRFCQHPIRWAITSQAFTKWRHLSTHPINRPATHFYRPRKDERLSWPSWLTCSGRFTHIMVTFGWRPSAEQGQWSVIHGAKITCQCDVFWTQWVTW